MANPLGNENGAPVVGLVGRTLGHSWSPVLHEQLGCSDYRLIEVEPDDLASLVDDPRLKAFNVTIPYKKAVMSLCDEVDPRAVAIGAVNTVVRDESGRLVGHNTDIDGLMYLVRRRGLDLRGKKVMVLGGRGGAARTCVHAAHELGADTVVVVSRSGDVGYGDVVHHHDVDIIFNATPVGMYPEMDARVLDLGVFDCLEGVVDCIYNPLMTDLLMQADAMDVAYSNGLPMLVAQAKVAEELFFGTPIDDDRLEELIGAVSHQMTSIVLVGMPGAGKSTVAGLLAEALGRRVVEIDDMIAREAGMDITGIFENHGEETFRRLEHAAIVEAGAVGGSIISCGGGSVLDEANYAPLKHFGRIYHLERDPDLLPREGRPLSLRADSLSEMYAARLPRYRRFRDVLVDNNGSLDATVNAIIGDFELSEPGFGPGGS